MNRPQWLIPIFCLIAVALLAALNSHARNTKIYTAAYSTGQIERSVVNSSSLAMILGEVRTNIADFIWVKTELYSHRGLRFKAHEDEQEELDADEVQSPTARRNAAANAQAHDHDHDHGHAEDEAEAEVHAEDETETESLEVAHDDEPTSPRKKRAKFMQARPMPDSHAGHNHDHTELSWIPSEKADFRGFIGVIQREVQPYGKHEFAQGSQILPWYRVQTAINPRHGRAYVIAGWLLLKAKDEEDHLTQAELFLKEGAKNNPDFFSIHVMLGRVLLAQDRHADAIEIFSQAREIALKKRPPDGKPEPHVWEDSDEEDFGFAVRYIPYIQFRILKDLTAAEKSTSDGLKLMPKDQPLRNFMRQIRKAKQEAANISAPDDSL